MGKGFTTIYCMWDDSSGTGEEKLLMYIFSYQKMLNHDYTLFNQTSHSVFNAFKLSRILLWSIIQMDIVIVFTYQ